jgi:inosine/guanosine/xanthosine phosphorylase family protein
MGASIVLLTNGAGGVRSDLQPGDLMAIDDHINAMGVNPLAGPHHPVWGPRFPDMSATYDSMLRTVLDEAARQSGIALRHGVYLAVAGPAYETPAEIKAFRAIGADAVGMSTVPEAMLARAAGLRVAGLSCITNMAAGEGRPVSHEDVLAAGAAAVPRLKTLVQGFVAGLDGRRL